MLKDSECRSLLGRHISMGTVAKHLALTESLLPLIAVSISPLVGIFITNFMMPLPEKRLIGGSQTVCASCHRVSRSIHPIPVFNWLNLDRKCYQCSASIGIFFPATEIGVIVIALWSAQAEPGWDALATFLLGCSLLLCAIIDMQQFSLPDSVTLSLIPAGIITTHMLLLGSSEQYIFGAIIGFFIFFIFSKLYHSVYSEIGLGLGDAKLLAGIGSWVGWQSLFLVIMIAACTGLFFVACHSLAMRRPIASGDRVAFGPFLALGGWLVWLYNPVAIFGDL